MENSPVDLALVLCLHTPYVPAPERRSLHANEPSEALWSWVSESVVPLLNVVARLEREGISARLSLAVSPLACEMLADIEAVPAYLKYLERQSSLARAHAGAFASRGQEMYRDRAAFWEAWYQDAERDFREVYASDLLGALRDMASRERIELVAAPATAGPLVLLGQRASVRAQLALAVECFKRHFGAAPRGLWTCRGVGHSLAREISAAGFEYAIEGAPTVLAGEAESDAGTRYAAHLMPWLGDALPRSKSSKRPELPAGNAERRLEGSLLCLRPHAGASEQAWHPGGYAGEERFLCHARRLQPGALRLWRNTGEKTPRSLLDAYEPLGTPSICEAQAQHWLGKVSEWARQSNGPQCVALDASLLGGLWFEGHAWLTRALKRAASDPRFELHFASHALTLGSMHSTHSTATSGSTSTSTSTSSSQPATSGVTSGGPEALGDSSSRAGATAWRNARNAALWDEVHECEATLCELAREHEDATNPRLRAILCQCAREMLLIQSGDWPLALASQPPRPRSREDARALVAAHIEAFRCLSSIARTIARGEMMTEGQRAYADALSERDDLFATADFTAWSEAEAR